MSHKLWAHPAASRIQHNTNPLTSTPFLHPLSLVPGELLLGNICVKFSILHECKCDRNRDEDKLSSVNHFSRILVVKSVGGVVVVPFLRPGTSHKDAHEYKIFTAFFHPLAEVNIAS